jgi:hypothetical protein
LEWDASPSENVAAYIVRAGCGDTPWTTKLKGYPQLDTSVRVFRRKIDTKDGVPFFRVEAVRKDALTSAPSPLLRLQPRVIDDLQVWAVDTKRVALAWAMPSEPDAGYHVERAPVEVFTEDQIVRLKKDTDPLANPSVGAIKSIGKFERITKEPLRPGSSGKTAAGVTWFTFSDTSIDLTKPTAVEKEAVFTHRFGKDQIDETGKPYRFGVYAYRVVAVNALGVESGPSAWSLTIPPAVESVFAREDDTKCHLTWGEMPWDHLKGYRVYRMDGPKINGAGQKVVRRTADPVNVAKWTDETGGTDTKRYWVVAVDALAQRYSLTIAKYLQSGAVFVVNAGQLAAMQQDDSQEHLSGDVRIKSSIDAAGVESVGADQVWAGSPDATAQTGKGITVAVIDSGIDATHNAL